MARKNKTEQYYSICKGNGVTLLCREIIKDGDTYEFYDVNIADMIIIKDCRVIEGKNGDFISAPARKAGDNYYPYAYIRDDVQAAILDLIYHGEWEDTDNTYLQFGKSKSKSKSKSKDKSKSTDDNGEDDYPF